MKKILILLLLLIAGSPLYADNNFSIGGYVRSAISQHELTDAMVYLIGNDGSPADSCKANKGMHWNGMSSDTTAYFIFYVPRVDSTYLIEAKCPGFAAKTVTFTVDNIGKREDRRELPTIFLGREVQLSEVTVQATKVKFYNKGDTLVYDATAFQLAEGSMLDALIAQLPGVELSTDGQIKVNGQYVESLLLDGRQFMDGNNNIMLENIGAYTVKTINVYEGVTNKNKALGNDFKKELIMDVRLKKEYSIGWLVNAQGGYGTDNRYLGRLFAMWFNPKWRVSFAGNINNLNDNRQPGRNDTWTPEQMPSGRKRTSLLALGYNYDDQNTESSAEGSISYAYNRNDLFTRTDHTNFLLAGNTYEKSFVNNLNKSTDLYTAHWASFRIGQFGIGGSITGQYTRSSSRASSLAGSFSENQDSISMTSLEAIYSVGSAPLLESIINRSKTQSDGWTKTISGSFTPSITYLIPKSRDLLLLRFGLRYSSTKNELWKDYEINYGPAAVPSEKLRQYFDNTPNHNVTMMAGLQYRFFPANSINIFLNYNYQFSEEVKDSYMYALDRLNDMGIYGTLPSGYLAAFDPANSYKSKTWTNENFINLFITYVKKFTDKVSLYVVFSPELIITHRKFNYWRDGLTYTMSKTNTGLDISGLYSGQLSLSFFESQENRKETAEIKYNIQTRTTLPDMFDMVDVYNDSDPLNIYIGNPALKPQQYYRHRIGWTLSPISHSVSNTLYFGYWYYTHQLTRGYTYDTSTGVRYNKMYNVEGDRAFMITDDLRWQFGTAKKFTLSSYSEFETSRATDMIGIDLQEPQLTKVHNRRLTENLKLNYKVSNSIDFGIRCDVTNRHTTSSQSGFSTLNATHVTAGINALFQIPGGVSINTDFLCYTRRGYGVDNLDTTDPVWNIRLSYCPPRNNKWVFMVDGFDMLHTLSNVNYAVTASGRTVSYTNVLPRYFLFSVQYRLSLQPKKR